MKEVQGLLAMLAITFLPLIMFTLMFWRIRTWQSGIAKFVAAVIWLIALGWAVVVGSFFYGWVFYYN